MALGKAMLGNCLVAIVAMTLAGCVSRVDTQRTFPPAADLRPAAEPAYPVEALEPGEAGEAAEKSWWNAVLLWGRGEHGKVARICNWARDLGFSTPAGYCDD